MASGKREIKAIVAVTHNEQVIILYISDFDMSMLDGDYVDDNCFENTVIIPKELGLYELECLLYWDDGCNAFFERTDGDCTIEVVKVNTLYKIH